MRSDYQWFGYSDPAMEEALHDYLVFNRILIPEEFAQVAPEQQRRLVAGDATQ